jgi:Holliday junction resolvasome RuvABC ATP-dependent DNA helicase subunit
MSVQMARYFFGKEFNIPEPTDQEKHAKISRSGNAPLAKFVGNDKAVRKLQVAAYKALGTEDHMMRDLAFAIFGPSSSGKTTLIRLYAEIVELPFIEISPKSVKTLNDVLKIIQSELEKQGVTLVGFDHFMLPPCVIFIDEVHALADNIVQGLLKATEFNDSVLVTENGKVIDTYTVTWAIATTEEGQLFDAFRTRFSPIQLGYLSKKEISQVVKLANPDLPEDVCDLVAHYNSRVPRKALEFARYMSLVKEMSGGDWQSVARQVAEDEGIDEFGMHEIYLKILKALNNGPVARNRISFIAGKKEEEVDKYIIPWLMTETVDQPALIAVSQRGYVITEAGLQELEKREKNIAA